KDYKVVNALQAQYKIVPLSAYGKPYEYEAPPVNPNPGFSMTDAPQKVINAMDTSTYFNMMAKLMGEAAPPAPEDAPILARMATIGLVPGQTFDMAKLDPAVQAVLKDINPAAMKRIEESKDSLGAMVHGWVVTKGLGQYGTNYMKRAVVAADPFDTPEQIVIRERINCVNSLAHWQIITESESIKEPRGRSRSQSYSQIALLHSHLFLHDQLTFADISGTDTSSSALSLLVRILN